MSFNVTTKVNKQINYPGLNLLLPTEIEELAVEIKVLGILSLYGNSGVVEYQAILGDTESFVNTFTFSYSGSGNPVLEAEEQLKIKLETDSL